jgi:hypothetical protein
MGNPLSVDANAFDRDLCFEDNTPDRSWGTTMQVSETAFRSPSHTVIRHFSVMIGKLLLRRASTEEELPPSSQSGVSSKSILKMTLVFF